MDWFLLQPFSVLALTQVVLLFIVALYLLSIKRKTRGTWLLALAFGLFGLAWVQLLLGHTVTVSLGFEIDPFDDFAIPLLLYVLLHFAYAFVYNPFPRESRIVLTGAGFLVGANAVYQIYRMITFVPVPEGGMLGVEMANFLLLLGSLIIYLRKWARLARGIDLDRHERPGTDQATQRDKARKAVRAFALLSVGLLLLSLRGVWVTATLLWPVLGTPSPFMEIVNLPGTVLIFLLFVVVYINHMPEPTTVQAKIIGLSLAMLLAVLGIADLVLFSEPDLQREARVVLPNQQTLRFEPDGQEGYRVAYIPFRFDPDLGDNLRLGPETETRVALGFAFPFSGTRWEEMYVDSNGLVTFGAPYLSRRIDDFYWDEQPKIAPYYRSLVPLATRRSGVFYKREADNVTVTWFLVWESLSGVPNHNTVQLVLHERGAIDFVYDWVDAPFDGRGDGLRGLRPGGAPPPVETVRFTELPPEAVTLAGLQAGRSLRFEPTGDGDYRRTPIPFDFDPELGENLHLGDDTNAEVTFDFSFPFYENQWREVYVSANGAVAFGGSINPPDSVFFRPLRDFFNAQPKIAPFFVDLNPSQGGGVFHKREADKTTITWHQVPLLGTPFINTVQLVLHQRGAIDFVYARVEVPLYGAAYWGLYAGDARPRTDAVDYLFDLNAYPAPAGATLVEDFNLVYRRFVHAKMAPLAYMVLVSTFLILGIFPLFFRTSLIKPLQALLQGVRRVDEGDLDARVPVRVNDEIGTLALNFNRMTSSLKDAEDQLKTYAEGLEARVAERTADLQKALHHLTEAQDQLIHAEKMASLGQLTAGIAHEIKNPLNFVNNFAQLSIELADELEEEIEGHEDKALAEVREALKEILGQLKQNAAKIREHGTRADGIVRSMLEHSRTGPSQRRAMDLNALVDEFVNLAYHGMRARQDGFNVTFERRYDEAVGEVEVVPQELGRVFVNLLNNAFDAVHAKKQTADGAYVPTIAVGTRRNGDTVEVQVRDNGTGIDEAVRQKIFEPFYTTKPTGEGTGLGLSLSYDIVTQGHGGMLAVESAEGEGATFIITLPVFNP